MYDGAYLWVNSYTQKIQDVIDSDDCVDNCSKPIKQNGLWAAMNHFGLLFVWCVFLGVPTIFERIYENSCRSAAVLLA